MAANKHDAFPSLFPALDTGDPITLVDVPVFQNPAPAQERQTVENAALMASIKSGISGLKSEITHLKDIEARQDAELIKLHKETVYLKAESARQDAELIKLHKETVYLKAESARQDAELVELNKEIVTLKAVGARQDERLAALKESSARQDRELDEIAKGVARLQARLEQKTHRYVDACWKEGRSFESCYPQASTLMKVYARRYEARLKKEARAPSPSHRAPVHAKPTQSPQPNGNASFSLLHLLQQILQTLSEWLNQRSSRSEPRANKSTVTTSHLFNAASSSATPSQERAHAPVSHPPFCVMSQWWSF